ncbi:MAG TPA: hypothetical protein VHH15_13450 [Actinophytocola sp.]|nr:hypothetical protein [Actinophytocola sp.]
MTALVRAAAVAVSMLVVASCGAANATGGVPSYSPGPPVPGASFVFEAEDGAHPVDGRSGEWVAPASEIMVWEHENIVKIDAAAEDGVEYIRVELNGPDRVPLEVGDYPDARDRDRVPDGPGMLVISGSLGCRDVYGEFTVDRLERDAAGQLVALDAGFTQRCGGPDGPALRGRVHFQS